jgi:precorrin-2 dehydrogenase/sirohydrochlorin ferrochelatase
MDGRTGLVVGGGSVGERKARNLLAAGVRVRIVSPDLTPGLEELAAQGQVEHLGGRFEAGHLEGAALVFAATSDREENRRVAREAEALGLWCNVADQPEEGSFIVPAEVRRGPLSLAVSTTGRSPALSARIQDRLEAMFGPEYGPLVEILGRARSWVLARGRSSAQNRDLFRRLVDSDLRDALARGETTVVNRILKEILGPDYPDEAVPAVFPETGI